MSLIAWYPLNGTLEDYSGNKNDLVAYSDFISDNNGKIGKCYKSSTTVSYASTKNNFYLNNNLSMCVWFKLDAYSTSPTAIITNHDHNTTSNFGINLASNKIAISIGYTDGTREWSNRNSKTTIELNKWYHVAITYKKSNRNLKLYVNGILEYNGNLEKDVKPLERPLQINRWSFNYSTSYTTTGRYNDIRIYNHELSVKEIKEIYKAKILHYKFDDPYEEPTVNLTNPQDKVVSTTINPGWDSSRHVGAVQVENWNTGYNGGVTSPSQGYHAHWVLENNKPIMKFINKNNSDGLSLGYRWLGIASDISSSKFTAGKVYTISWEQRVDEINQGICIGLYHRLQGGTSNSFHNGSISDQKTNKNINVWEKKSYTFTLSSNYDNTTNPSVYVYGNRSSGQGIVYVKNVQIEEKNHDTPFINGGTRQGVVRDHSGLRNHGIVDISSSPTWVDNSALGVNCISKINGVDKYLKINGNTRPTDELTISFWMKIDNNSNPSWTSLFGGGRDGGSTAKNGISIHVSPENKIFTKFYGSTSKVDMNSSVLNLSGWNHIVITHKSNSHNIYINNIKSSNTTDIGSIDWSGISNIYLGRATDTFKNREISIDDFRMYSTALSDSDVKELFESRASISKNGRLFTSQIIERGEQTNLIKPNDISVGNLTATTMSITTADNTGKRILKNSATTSGTFRIAFPLDILTPYVGKNLTFSFNYRFLKGNIFTFTDWCDGTISKVQSNGIIRAQGVRSAYDNTFRFMDCSIGADTEMEIWNIRLEQSDVSSYKTNINKKGILYTEEINELDFSSMKTKEEFGAKWVRLFYHNNKSGTVLFSSNKKEFLKCNTEDKVSDLWAMEMFRGVDGKFEFLLQYDGTSSYNRWKQSSNFTKENIKGYEAVQVSWTGNYWGGLEPSTSNASWVDGSVNHANWFYAIGTKNKYQDGMPHYSGSTASWVEVWVRCDDMGIFKMIKNGTCRATEFIEV